MGLNRKMSSADVLKRQNHEKSILKNGRYDVCVGAELRERSKRRAKNK